MAIVPFIQVVENDNFMDKKYKDFSLVYNNISTEKTRLSKLALLS